MIVGDYLEPIMDGACFEWARRVPASPGAQAYPGKVVSVQRNRFTRHAGHILIEAIRHESLRTLVLDGWDMPLPGDSSNRPDAMYEVIGFRLTDGCGQCYPSTPKERA